MWVEIGGSKEGNKIDVEVNSEEHKVNEILINGLSYSDYKDFLVTLNGKCNVEDNYIECNGEIEERWVH